VPLAKQAVQILQALKPFTESTGLVFPNMGKRGRCISENSVRTALIALGYTSERQTWHGFRASARTMLAEVLDCNPLFIEAQLAHAVKDANGQSYNRTTYLKQRQAMMQKWADYLDSLTATARIIEFKSA
jgi:integrase